MVGTGRLRRYVVELEASSPLGADEFAIDVDRILQDPRSWIGSGEVALQRVDRAPVDFRITLARPTTVDRLCRPMRTDGIYSCWNHRRAVINLARWQRGADTYGDDLVGYRRYLINHEVGHALDYRHAACPGRGRPAPVMMQQTSGVGICAPNPWPFPHARALS